MADGVSYQGDGDEIDLRAYAIVLWRRRWLILAVTAVAVLLTAIATQLTPPTYEAASVLMVARTPYQVGAPPDPRNPGLKIGASLPQDIPAETLVAFARHPSTIDDLARALHRSSRAFRGNLKAVVIRNTPLIELRVRGRDPADAARIANAWAGVVLADSQALFASTARRSLAFFEGRTKGADKALRQAEQAQRNFAATSRLALLQTQVSALTSQISSYRARLVDLVISIERTKTELAQTDTELAHQPRTLALTKSIDSDPVMLQAARERGQQELRQWSAVSLRTEELNPVYLSLAGAQTTLVVRLRALETERAQVVAALTSLNQELDQARRELATEQLTASRLAEAVATARQTYDVLLQRSEESRVASASDSAPVRVAAQAVVPEAPVGSRRLLLLALAGMLGAVVGTLSALLAEAITTGSGQRQIVRGEAPAHPIS